MKPSAALDNLRYMARRDFHPFWTSRRDMKASRKTPGYASLPSDAYPGEIFILSSKLCDCVARWRDV